MKASDFLNATPDARFRHLIENLLPDDIIECNDPEAFMVVFCSAYGITGQTADTLALIAEGATYKKMERELQRYFAKHVNPDMNGMEAHDIRDWMYSRIDELPAWFRVKWQELEHKQHLLMLMKAFPDEEQP